MSAAEHTILSADAYVQEMLRAAEAQTQLSRALNRRAFLKLAGVAGGGLALAFYIGDRATALANTNGGGQGFAPNAFLRIAPDGSILIYAKNPESRPGREDLVADDRRGRARCRLVEGARRAWRRSNSALYGRQSAGGSRSIPTNWDQLRRAGATARAMLVSAAAKEWGVARAECTTENSSVVHSAEQSPARLRRAGEQGRSAARSRREVAQAEGAQGLQTARQAHHRRRQPDDRHRPAAVRHRPGRAGHALRRVREMPGHRRQGRRGESRRDQQAARRDSMRSSSKAPASRPK